VEVVAIDLGSNTLRVIGRDCEKGVFTLEYEKMVKTADKLIQTQQISPQAVQRIIEALKEADAHLDFSTKKVKATTTAAMRMADNAVEVIDTIFKQTGVLFEIIEASFEAYLTNLGVSKRMDSLGLGSDPFFLLDVGGGSTEVIYSFNGTFTSKSLDVGIVTMSQKYTTKETLVAAMYQAFEPLKDFKDDVQKERPAKSLVATAGTPTTMASLKHGLTVATYDAKKINGTILSVSDLDQGLQRLMSMDEMQRSKHVGVGRDILIIAGVEILKVLYDILGFESAIVIDDGLREGLAIHSCSS